MSQPLSQEDMIVALMGPTGAGKSTFVEHATSQDGQTVCHGWQSSPLEVRTVRVPHPTDGRPVVFIDNPGFDDTFKSDTEILAMIADWLVKAYKGKVNIATILYLHRISDNRMSGAAMKNLRLFSSLCGQTAMPNVVIVTTMWAYVPEHLGVAREEALKKEVWKEMVDDGCRIERFGDTHESAWNIIDSPAKNERAKVLLPREMIDAHLRLNETRVGIALNKELAKLIKDQKDAARRLREQVKEHDNEFVVQELNGRKAELEAKILDTAEKLHEMKIPFTRKIRLLFKGKFK